MQIVDSGADLNAYAKVENQSDCCSSVMDSTQPAASSGCCSTKPAASGLPVVAAESCCGSSTPDGTLHDRLRDLLTRYNVNDYAASVKVFAVKPA